METRFKWQAVKTEYREIRKSAHREELRWLINRETIVDTETGQTITRSVLRHPGICVIVPYLDDDRILLMQQYRFAIADALWELPAGTLEGREENARMVATESPAECAARELLEETGYEARHLEKLGEAYAMPGTSDELIHVFRARELTRREQKLDEGEVIYEIKPFNQSQLKSMIANGEIRDAKTLVALFLTMD